MARPRRALNLRIRLSALGIALGALLLLATPGCLAIKVVETAADAAVTTVSTGVKVTGAVAGAAIPDGDDDEADEE